MKFQALTALSITIMLVVGACSSNPSIAPSPTETLSPTIGRVFGVLEIRKEQTTEPVTNTILYLAPTVKDSTGNELMVGFERTSSLKFITNDKGEFVFSNVPPGNYGLILDKVVTSYLLPKPDSDVPFLIQVSGGKEANLGKLVYDSLPMVSPPKSSPYP